MNLTIFWKHLPLVVLPLILTNHEILAVTSFHHNFQRFGDDTRRTGCKINLTFQSQKAPNLKVLKLLSISMADNVISYNENQKKLSKTQNRWFYFINWAPELRNDQLTRAWLVVVFDFGTGRDGTGTCKKVRVSGQVETGNEKIYKAKINISVRSCSSSHHRIHLLWTKK